MARVLSASILFFLLVANRAAFADSLEGDWTIEKQKTTYKVLNWGIFCGDKPESTNWVKSGARVILTETGQEFRLKGGPVNLKTDGCNTDNKMSKVTEHKGTPNSWGTTCKTPVYFEKNEDSSQLFELLPDGKLHYKGFSIVRWVEDVEACHFTRDIEMFFVKGAGQAEKAAEPKCAAAGAAETIEVTPANPVLAPGEKICFAARVLDASGCKVEGEAQWSAGSKGLGEVDEKGCFSAPETLPEEGSFQMIYADLRPARGWTKVSFASATKLGAEEAPAAAAPDGGTGAGVQAVVGQQRVRVHGREPAKEDARKPGMRVFGLDELGIKVDESYPESSSDIFFSSGGGRRFPVALIVLVVLVLGGGAGALLVAHRRGKAKMAGRAEKAEKDAPAAAAEAATKPEEEKTPEKPKVTCPKCGRQFDAGSRFCPYDRAVLGDAVSKLPAEQQPEPGPKTAVYYCFKCGREFAEPAKFCPYDRSPLQAGAKKPGSEAEATGGKTCPGCGTRYLPGAKFCGNCGKTL